MDLLTVEVAASSHGTDIALFRLMGHLDAQTVHELESSFDRQVKAARVRWIVDLSRLEYISSAGLGSFIGVLSELRSRGGDIYFVDLSPKLAKIFKVLGFTRIFKVFVSEAEAARAFQGN